MWWTPAGWCVALALALTNIIAAADTPASRVETVCTTDAAYCDPPPTQPRQVWAHCEQWHDLAAAVGWPENQGYVLQYVMWRESRCNPDAYNRDPCDRQGRHALGLMQRCVWPSQTEFYDPVTNLANSLALWERSGWRPWCLAGDPVTGRC